MTSFDHGTWKLRTDRRTDDLR